MRFIRDKRLRKEFKIEVRIVKDGWVGISGTPFTFIVSYINQAKTLFFSYHFTTLDRLTYACHR